jgi:hypothetical protein
MRKTIGAFLGMNVEEKVIMFLPYSRDEIDSEFTHVLHFSFFILQTNGGSSFFMRAKRRPRILAHHPDLWFF